MTFKAGQSGNPSGRRKGSLNKSTHLAKLLEGHADELITKLIDLARDGDLQALKICTERLIPKLAHTPIDIELPEEINSTNLDKVKGIILRGVIEGKLSVSDAERLTVLITHQVSTAPMPPTPLLQMPIDPVAAANVYRRFMQDT